MQTTIQISDAACAYIKKMLEKDQGIGFCLSIKKTGCSGYSYVPKVVTNVPETKYLLELHKGINVYLDATWLHLLQGIHIDYIEEEKTGLKQKRLVFTNPNESSRCGCGESFHIESK